MPNEFGETVWWCERCRAGFLAENDQDPHCPRCGAHGPDVDEDDGVFEEDAIKGAIEGDDAT